MPTPTPAPDPLAEIRNILYWADEDTTAAEARALAALSRIARQDPALATTVASYSWVVDNVSGNDEVEPLESLAILAEADRTIATGLVGFSWIADGISFVERLALDDLAVLAVRSSSSAASIVEFPWLSDGVTREERFALFYVSSMAERDIRTAETVGSYKWLVSDVTDSKVESLRLLQSLLDKDLVLGRQVAEMPFLDTSYDEHDEYALSSIRQLAQTPSDLAELTDQPWYQNGLDEQEAAFVAVLGDLVDRSPAEFRELLKTRKTRARTISLPLAGEVDLFAFRLTDFHPNSTVLDQVEDAARAIEGLMGVAFPRKEIIVLFLDPFEFQPVGDVILALHVGTHLVVSRPEVIQGDFSGALAHEVAHYYWNSRNAPLWFSEGGSDFLASYALDQSQRRSLALDIRSMDQCALRGVEKIQQLLDLLSSQGYAKHAGSPQFVCNYVVGEYLLSSLHQAMGFEGTNGAWNELYLLAESKRFRITENEIYQAFASNSTAGQLSEVNALYDRWHGGEIPN